MSASISRSLAATPSCELVISRRDVAPHVAGAEIARSCRRCGRDPTLPRVDPAAAATQKALSARTSRCLRRARSFMWDEPKPREVVVGRLALVESGERNVDVGGSWL